MVRVPSDLHIVSSVTVAALMRWFFKILARRFCVGLVQTLLRQVLPGSTVERAMKEARLRLARVLVVIARWFIYNIYYFNNFLY